MISGKLERLSLRETVGMVVALLFFAGVLADRLVARPTIARIAAVRAEIEMQRELLANHRAILAFAPAVDARFESMRPRFADAEPAAAAIDRLQGRLDELARKTGLVIHAMRHRESAAAETVADAMTVIVEISRFESDPEALLAFLYELRASPEIWRVARLNLAPERSGDGGSRLGGAMTVAQLRLRP